MSRDWFDEWLDSDENDGGYLDEESRPVSWIELGLVALVGGVLAVLLIVCAISVLVLVFGGVTLLFREFAVTKWLAVIGVVAGLLYWEKKSR